MKTGKTEQGNKGSDKDVREDEEVVGGSHGNRVLSRVPGGVEDLLGKVDRLDVDIVLAVLVVDAGHHLVPGRSHTLSLECRLVRLQCHIVLAVAVVDVKVVVVRSRQHIASREKERESRVECAQVSTDEGVNDPFAYQRTTTQGARNTYFPSPLKVHSNLSKMQSFS